MSAGGILGVGARHLCEPISEHELTGSSGTSSVLAVRGGWLATGVIGGD